MSKSTIRAVFLVATLAGMACDSAVQSARQDLAEDQAQVAKDQAKLSQDQRDEQEKLNAEQARDQHELAQDNAAPPHDPGEQADVAKDRLDLAAVRTGERH